MKRLSKSIVMIVLLLIVAGPRSFACGDKFILGSSGSQLERATTAKHPGRILVYREPNSETAAALKDPELDKYLKQAGHSTRDADGPQDLQYALGADRFDLVLVDYRAASRLRDQLVSKGLPIRVVPVLDRGSRQFLSAAKQEFKVVLNVPASVSSVLTTIDKAMALH